MAVGGRAHHAGGAACANRGAARSPEDPRGEAPHAGLHDWCFLQTPDKAEDESQGNFQDNVSMTW